MSHPPKVELRLLSEVADELREVVAERGYRVEVAVEADPSFGSGRSRAALISDLVIDAVSGASSRVGLDFRPVNGSGRELRSVSNDVDRRYRVRRARRRHDGEIIIHSNSDSALATSDLSLFAVEQWVFAWTLASDGMMGEVLLAEVVGYLEGSPGRLKLGPAIALGGTQLPYGEFRPIDEGLDDFEDDEESEGGFGSSGS